MIFDTSFVIDLVRNKERALKKLEEIENRDESWGVSSITVFELWSGLARGDHSETEKKKIREVLGSNMVIDFESTSAQIGGLIHGKMKNKGETMSSMDALIAGAAMANSETLLTGNEKHFSKIKDLDLETY